MKIVRSKNESYLDDSSLQVRVDVDFSDHRGADVSQVEVARLIAEARPARRHLAIDRHDRRAVSVARISVAREVENIKANTGIRREDGVLARDDRHRERKETARLRRHAREIRGECPILVHVPHSQEARGGR